MARQNQVYFVQAGDTGPIKISRSVDVDRRVRDLKTASSNELHVLATISCDAALEGELHQRFAAFRLNGDWFSPAPALLDLIATLPKEGTATIASVRARLFARKSFDGPANIDEVLATKLRNLPSDNSRRAYAKDWQAFCAWLTVQQIDALGVTPRIVRAYVAHQHEAGLARPTVSRNLSVIREIYGAFVADELMVVNPAREIKNPRVSHEPKTPWLNEEDARKLFAVPATTWKERRDGLVARLLFGLGWRRAEVARMTAKDFDLKAGTVTGIVKGNKKITVGVPEWLQEDVAAWVEYAGIKSGPIIPRFEGDNRSVTPETLYNAVVGLAARAGVKINPHGLRRTIVTITGERGVGLKQRQLMVGHANQATTERYDRARDAAKNAPGQVVEDIVRGDKS